MEQLKKTALKTIALRTTVTLIAGLCVGLVLQGCSDKTANKGAANTNASPTTNAQNTPAVDFKEITGKPLSTQSLRGKVTLVNFWATSCTTCVAEMPMLMATHEKYKAQGYDTVAVAMSYDRADYVLNFKETRKLPFHVALDIDGVAAKAFGEVKVTPTSYLLDKQGKIVKRYVGAPNEAELHATIEGLLKS